MRAVLGYQLIAYPSDGEGGTFLKTSGGTSYGRLYDKKARNSQHLDQEITKSFHDIPVNVFS